MNRPLSQCVLGFPFFDFYPLSGGCDQEMTNFILSITPFNFKLFDKNSKIAAKKRIFICFCELLQFWVECNRALITIWFIFLTGWPFAKVLTQLILFTQKISQIVESGCNISFLNFLNRPKLIYFISTKTEILTTSNDLM